MWTRRRFLTGLGLATVAVGCKRAPRSSTEEIAVGSSATVSDAAGSNLAGSNAVGSAQPPGPTPGAGDLIQPGFFRVGRSPLAFDGEELVELGKDALIRRTASLAEISRTAFSKPRSFAVLRDHSVLVLTDEKTATRRVHHVVAGKVATTHDSLADLVFPTASPTAYWAVGSSTVKRTEIGTSEDHADVFLPENTYPDTAAVASDGSLVMSNLYGILRIDRALVTYKWANNPNHLGPGPDADTVWAGLGPIRKEPSKVALLKLAGDRATEIAAHALAPGEELVHATGSGPFAAAIVARSLGAHRAAFTLIVYDAKGERWRASLGEVSGAYFAVLSPTRVVVLAPTNTLRAWDVATGKAT